jgi:hypothetical protein
MKYAVEAGSGVMIYIPSFIKIGSGIQKLIGGDTQRQHGDRISLLQFFFRNMQSGLKTHLGRRVKCPLVLSSFNRI